jgi:hypothetical protein
MCAAHHAACFRSPRITCHVMRWDFSTSDAMKVRVRASHRVTTARDGHITSCASMARLDRAGVKRVRPDRSDAGSAWLTAGQHHCPRQAPCRGKPSVLSARLAARVDTASTPRAVSVGHDWHKQAGPDSPTPALQSMAAVAPVHQPKTARLRPAARTVFASAHTPCAPARRGRQLAVHLWKIAKNPSETFPEL